MTGKVELVYATMHVVCMLSFAVIFMFLCVVDTMYSDQCILFLVIFLIYVSFVQIVAATAC